MIVMHSLVMINLIKIKEKYVLLPYNEQWLSHLSICNVMSSIDNHFT